MVGEDTNHFFCFDFVPAGEFFLYPGWWGHQPGMIEFNGWCLHQPLLSSSNFNFENYMMKKHF